MSLEEVPEGTTSRPGARTSESPPLSRGPVITLRFQLRVDEPEGLQALCSARRAMLLEEKASQLEGDEPPLEDALFSPAEIIWAIQPQQRDRCLKKLAELVQRANRSLEHDVPTGTDS